MSPPDADAVAAALDFKSNFAPQDGVDYGWVITRAKEHHAHLVASLRRLDDKAGTIISYLGGGSSVLALGTFAGIAAGKVNPWVVVAALIPITLTVATLVFAARARRTTELSVPPGVQVAVDYANYHKEQAEIRFLGLWHLAITEMHPLVNQKARLIDTAIWLFVATVASFTIPLIAIAVLPRPV